MALLCYGVSLIAMGLSRFATIIIKNPILDLIFGMIKKHLFFIFLK